MESLFTIYGARKAKDGNRVNISIVTGEEANKCWGVISLKTGESTAKTKALVKDGFLYIKVPMLKEEAPAEAMSQDEVPF